VQIHWKTLLKTEVNTAFFWSGKTKAAIANGSIEIRSNPKQDI